MARRSLPPLNALKAFEALGRHGRMTAAADELCVTHGAVSRQVKRLEQALGLTLVEGPRSAIRLTEAGRKLADELTPVFDRLAGVMPASAARPLEVSSIGTLATKWLIPRLPRFLERHAGINVRLTDANGRDGDDEVDVTLQMTHDVPAGALETVEFMVRHHALLVAPAIAKRGLGLVETLSLPRLRARTYPGEWEAWSQASGVMLPPAPSTQEFDRYSHMLQAAVAGIGVAVGSWSSVAAELEAGELVAPFGFVEASSAFVYCRLRDGAEPSAALFRDWLVEEGARMAAPPGCGPRAKAAGSARRP